MSPNRVPKARLPACERAADDDLRDDVRDVPPQLELVAGPHDLVAQLLRHLRDATRGTTSMVPGRPIGQP
jgi:hypothetical protein